MSAADDLEQAAYVRGYRHAQKDRMALTYAHGFTRGVLIGLAIRPRYLALNLLVVAGLFAAHDPLIRLAERILP